MNVVTKIAAITGAILLGSASLPASAAVLDIQLTNLSGLSTTQLQVFEDAEDFWETHITGYQDGLNINAVVIDASGTGIDGVGGILGQAGPTAGFFQTATSGQEFALTTNGIMQFDTADLFNLEVAGTLFDVILHEMAHVLGFGTLWELNGLYDGEAAPGQYTGQKALAVYNEEFSQNAAFIPVELDGGPGTIDAHWDETWAGGSSDIMTGFLEGPTTISDTTLASFEDLGFTTTLSAVPLPAPFWLAMFGYGALMVTNRRKKAAA